jgi:hypothetical protein
MIIVVHYEAEGIGQPFWGQIQIEFINPANSDEPGVEEGGKEIHE